MDNVTNVQEPQQREKTFGEILVGVDFNPSLNPKVHRAKQICAELADLVKDHYDNTEYQSSSKYCASVLIDHTIAEILNAQMNVVKILTLK